jgi:hypothetical protein
MAPTPFLFPLPREAGEGVGRGLQSGPRQVGAKLCRPSVDGLTHSAHFGYRAPEGVQCVRLKARASRGKPGSVNFSRRLSGRAGFRFMPASTRPSRAGQATTLATPRSPIRCSKAVSQTRS